MTKAPIAELPQDVATCHEVIRQLFDRLNQQQLSMEEMRHQMQQLLRDRYGRKSESISFDQLRLFTGSVEQSEPVETGEQQSVSSEPLAKLKHGRRKLPKDLPRRRVVHDVPEEQRPCPCCGKVRVKIGEDTSERYDYIPASVWVVEHVRVKYACSDCQENVVIAEQADGPIPKGLPEAGMLAYVSVSKLADHLPLNRLEGIFRRQGVHIARSTMCDWIAATAGILTPLYEHMKARLLKSRIIWTDDTPVDMQDRTHEKNIREARSWVYIGDEANKFTIFDFTESRKRDGPKSFLETFNGFLQADAFAGYDCIYAAGEVLEVACMAHARRKFVDALNSDKQTAGQAIAMIQYLYRIEKDAAALTAAERRVLRLKKAAPMLHSFKKWLNDQRLYALPKSPLGKAVQYALNNWRALCRYLLDGELTIDNNRSERAIRTIAIGRKNWLFAGSKEGGRNAAIIASIIATCKQHDLNPQEYLRDVLIRLTSSKNCELDQLFPGVWIPAAL